MHSKLRCRAMPAALCILFGCWNCFAAGGVIIKSSIWRFGTTQFLPVSMDINVTNESGELVPLYGKLGDLQYIHEDIEIISDGELRMECKGSDSYNRGGKKEFSLAPGQTSLWDLEIATIAGLTRPGTFRVKAVWDSRHEENGWRGYAESEWESVTIEAARGDDLLFIEAVKTTRPARDWECHFYETAYSQQVWRKYPKSSYSPWTLFFAGLNCWADKELCRLPIDQVLTKKDKKYKWLEGKRGARMIDELEFYLKEKSDFIFADWLRFEIAFISAYRGDYEKAARVSEQLFKDAGQKLGGSEAWHLLTYLKKRGLVKN